MDEPAIVGDVGHERGRQEVARPRRDFAAGEELGAGLLRVFDDADDLVVVHLVLHRAELGAGLSPVSTTVPTPNDDARTAGRAMRASRWCGQALRAAISASERRVTTPRLMMAASTQRIAVALKISWYSCSSANLVASP